MAIQTFDGRTSKKVNTVDAVSHAELVQLVGADFANLMPSAAALADDTSNPTLSGVAAYGMDWDGGAGGWQRRRCNSSELLYALAQRTANVSGAWNNRGHAGALFTFNITAYQNVADSLLVQIYHMDPQLNDVLGGYIYQVAFPAGTVAAFGILIHPGGVGPPGSTTHNKVLQYALPRLVYVSIQLQPGGAGRGITFSASVQGM